MQVDVKVLLKTDRGVPFMGIGLLWLLEGITEHHSVTRAARAMGLSYPKALRMLRTVERGLGRAVVTRRKGGSDRGGAELTPFGRDFVARYDRLQSKIKRFGATAFERDLAALVAKPRSKERPQA